MRLSNEFLIDFHIRSLLILCGGRVQERLLNIFAPRIRVTLSWL